MQNKTEIVLRTSEILQVQKESVMTIVVDTEKVDDFKKNIYNKRGGDIYKYIFDIDATCKENSLKESNHIQVPIEEAYVEEVQEV